MLAIYQPKELYGKSIKDKRGGENNIHSWKLGIRGETTDEEKDLLNRLLKERRKKHWAEIIGIDWMGCHSQRIRLELFMILTN